MTQTVPSSALSVNAAELVGDMMTQESDVSMMIGIGLVKDTDAVFFHYVGEEQQPQALMLPSGKPLQKLINVRLSGISIARDIGTFNATKLNLIVESAGGKTVMLTSGLTTMWSQCVITALMGMFNSYDLQTPFQIDTWKGNTQMRPCFASLKINGNRVSDDMLYTQLREARSDGDKKLVLKIMEDSVEILSAALAGGAPEPVSVVVEDEEVLDF